MDELDVSPAAGHELLPALRLLFPDRDADICRDRLGAGANAFALFVARSQEGQLRAAVLVQVLSGATGLVAAPRGESMRAVNAAAGAGCGWLRTRGVKVCQAFAALDSVAELHPLRTYGFGPVTELVFLRREVGAPTSSAAPAVRLRWRPWDEAPTPEQTAALLATHEATLDCPELNVGRTAEEIVAAFRASDTTNRMWWSALDENNTAVGVMLFEGKEGDALELAYLGLVPSARGRGLSDALIPFADRIAAAADYRLLEVSVDARNRPAMKLYSRHGFVEYDRRAVWLAVWAA